MSVWSNTVIDYGCRIGDRVKIHANCYVAQYTEIVDDAFLAPGVTIANDLYPGQTSRRRVMSGPRIGAGAQLGVNVTVLPYVRIGDGCLVGAGLGGHPGRAARDRGVRQPGEGPWPGRRSWSRSTTRVTSDPDSASRFRLRDRQQRDGGPRVERRR